MIAALAVLLAAAPAPDTGRFQQGVDYRIEARLDESTHVLTGRARMRYTNRSGRALDSLYLHQHLNAFRPNSVFARREAQLGQRRFQTIGADDHAFERLRAVSVDGREVRPAYPVSPDSTVVAIPLGQRLAPGASVTVTMDWDARLATVPRRQGRRGRHYDWAHWYPRIAVLDSAGWQWNPLHPQGEFYGEFASYDVTLDLTADQVVGATGVAVEGNAGFEPTAHEKAAYPARPADPLGLLTGDAGEGRKRVRWRADDVMHFAWSADPRYRHDGVDRFSMSDAGGDASTLPGIHVLYVEGDTGWAGTVARRTHASLGWLQGKFGPYPWPQLTIVHRLESGGTEFPMLVMNGSASEGLIVHEVTHQWLHGIMANNEWRHGWLDEGFTSFMTNWWFEEKGEKTVWRRTMEAIAASDRAGRLEPIALPGHAFSTSAVYGGMTYTRASVVFRMLREMLGEETFTRGLRLYYRQNRLRHVSPEDFRGAMEQASGRDLKWFFDQWITRTDRLDYGIARVSSVPAGRGRWRTTVEVLRTGEAWMPLTLRVGDQTRTLDSRDRRQWVTVTTASKPVEVVLDPDLVLLDMDLSNNRAGVP